MFVAPWLVPPDYVGAMKAGASLGEGLRGQDFQAAEAGNRLRLAYDQLAASSNEHSQSLAAQQESTQAAQALHAQQQTALEAWRHSQELMHQQALTDSEKKVAAAEALRTKTTSDAIGFLGAKDTNVDHAAGVAGPNRPDSMLLPQYPEAINNPVVRHNLEQGAGAQLQSGPIQGVPLLDVSGKPIPGKTAIRTKMGLHVVDDHSLDSPLQTNRMNDARRKAQWETLRPEINALKLRLSKMTANSASRPAAQAKLNALEAKQEALFAAPAGPAGAGATHIWDPATKNFKQAGGAAPAQPDLPPPGYELQPGDELQTQPEE